MKKTVVLSLLCFFALVAHAQFPENFDTHCVIPNSMPSGWMVYNPISATIPEGQWECTVANGRPNTGGTATPGMVCTGVYGGTYNMDTSFLISPVINMNLYSSATHIYLRYDARKETVLLSGRLNIITQDSVHTPIAELDTPYLTPVFGNPDSSDWVTYEADLSNYKHNGSIYIAFRYTSATTSGSAWYLDNVLLTTASLRVPDMNKKVLPLVVTGNSTSAQISIAYTAPVAGLYQLVIYDMVGRKAYEGRMDARAGQSTYTINGLSMQPGMYCLKMGNDNTYGTAKFVIQ